MPTDFSKSSIYRIDCDITGLVYVGSTAQELHHRWADHKKASKKPINAHFKLYKSFAEHGIEHHHIELIEEIAVENRQQLNAREGHWIRQLDTYINGLNGKISGRKAAEWFVENKDKIAEKKAEYYIENKDKINEYKAEYRVANKEKIANYNKLHKTKLWFEYKTF